MASPQAIPSSPRTVSRAVPAKARKQAPNKRLFQLLAETFQALGDPSRVEIVWALSRQEMSVGSIAREVNMSQPAVSHHLRTLRNLRLVRVRRDGRTAFYSLDDEHIDRLLQEGLEHVEDLES